MTTSSGLTETAHPLRVEDTPERSLLHCRCRKKQKSFSLFKLVLSASTTAGDLQSFLDREKLWLTLDMLAFQIYQTVTLPLVTNFKKTPNTHSRPSGLIISVRDSSERCPSTSWGYCVGKTLYSYNASLH